MMFYFLERIFEFLQVSFLNFMFSTNVSTNQLDHSCR